MRPVALDISLKIVYNNYVVFICIILLWQYMQLCFTSLRRNLRS